MYWAKKQELTPEQVKKLAPEVEVHLEGRDRYGELTWIEGKVVQSGKSKVFSYLDHNFMRQTKSIKVYPNKHWTIQA